MKTIRYLNSEELRRFKKELRKSKLYDLAFDLTLTYGLRVQELVNLKLQDFDFENRQVEIRAVKNGLHLKQPLNGKITSKYRAWLRLRKKLKMAEDNDYLFPSRTHWGEPRSRDSFQSTFKQLCQKANISPHSIHDLRHTAAIELITKGALLVEVRDWLRQKQLSSTEVYVRYLNSKKAEKKNLEILSALL